MFSLFLPLLLSAALVPPSAQCARRPSIVTSRQFTLQVRCAATPADYLRLSAFSEAESLRFTRLAREADLAIRSREAACPCGKHGSLEHERILLDYYRSQARSTARSAEKFEQMAATAQH